ncbi:MAG: TolC family protein [Elusimicrobia bacterium]|nr:TolC family protein [Elusimicrobiota bacterium]
MTRRLSALWLAAVAIPLLSGCASYSPMILPTVPDLAQTPSLGAPAMGLQVPGLAVSTQAAQGLDARDAMALAVVNDPDLKAARLRAGVAEAQLIEAGLLPDPHLSAGVGRGPQFTGYSEGISEDLQAFVLRGAAQAQARAHRKEVDLTILWQEWQVAVTAGRLFVRARRDEDLEEVFEWTRKLLAEQYDIDQADFQQSASAIQKVAADLTVLADADAGLRRIQLDADTARHRLNYLLGLAPQARPALAKPERPGAAANQAFSQDQFEAALAALGGRRVDLLALQAGYESQEQRLRKAVLAQFPALNVGLSQGQDPQDNIPAVNLGFDIGLPVFNGNRGQIAIERASRAVLRADYQARLDEAHSEADRLWQATLIMAKQLERLQAQTSALKAIAAAAEQQFRSGTMDTGAYVGLETSLLKDAQESIRLRAALDSDRLTLDALLGLPFGATR